MATSKKKRTQYTSKGTGRHRDVKIQKAIKRDRSVLDVVLMRLAAWQNGKTVNGYDGRYIKPYFKMPSQITNDEPV